MIKALDLDPSHTLDRLSCIGGEQGDVVRCWVGLRLGAKKGFTQVGCGSFHSVAIIHRYGSFPRMGIVIRTHLPA